MGDMWLVTKLDASKMYSILPIESELPIQYQTVFRALAAADSVQKYEDFCVREVRCPQILHVEVVSKIVTTCLLRSGGGAECGAAGIQRPSSFRSELNSGRTLHVI